MNDFTINVINSKNWKKLFSEILGSVIKNEMHMALETIKVLQSKGILIEWDCHNDESDNLVFTSYCYYRDPETKCFNEESFEYTDLDFDKAIQEAILYGINL